MKRHIALIAAATLGRISSVKDNTLLMFIIVHVIFYSALALVAYDAHRSHSTRLTTLEKQQRHSTERIGTIDEIAKIARREAGAVKKQLDRQTTKTHP